MVRRKEPSIRLDNRRRVLDGFLNIDEITYSHDRVAGSGRLEGRKRLVMERGEAAAALLHETDTDTVLLTRQVRAATIANGPGLMSEIVAGVIEAGETPQACIRREIKEEIGYRLPKAALRRIGTFYVSPGGTSERIHLFYAAVESSDRVAPEASGEAGEGEDVALVKVSRKAFVRQAITGRLNDAKTLISGLWLACRERGHLRT